MTLGDWLATRTPPAPPALAARLEVLLRAELAAPESAVADRCMDAAERLLTTMVERAGTSRDAALDLLAADALVTYAFEAASDEPARLEERARQAMHRIAALVDEAPIA